MKWATLGRIVAAPVRVPARAIQHGTERVMMGMIASVIARQLVTMIGGGVAGAADGALVGQLSGALVAVMGAGWSVYQNRGAGPWTREQTFGMVRHLLTAAGGVYVGQGVLTDDAATAGAGGAATVLAILWSAFEKRKVAKPSPPE